jgi:hypothetical protein
LEDQKEDEDIINVIFGRKVLRMQRGGMELAEDRV